MTWVKVDLRGRKRPATPMSEPIAVVQSQRPRNEKGHHPVVFAVETGKPTADQLRRFMPRYFTDEKIREVGVSVLAAWVARDHERVEEILTNATTDAEHLFTHDDNYDHEPVLARQALAYMIESCQIEGQNGIWKDGKFDVETFKKNIEARFNNRKPLAQHRWRRVQKALSLPFLAMGAAASNYKRKRNSRRRKGSTKF
jgi:hypothetical protein